MLGYKFFVSTASLGTEWICVTFFWVKLAAQVKLTAITCIGIFIVMVLPQVWRGSLPEGESFPVVNADEVDSQHFLVHWECVLE